MLLNGIADKKIQEKELDDYTIGMVTGRITSGSKNLDSADMAKGNVNTVKTIRTKYTRTGKELIKKRPGRPPAMSERDQRAVVKAVLSEALHPFTYHLITDNKTNVRICIDNLIKYLKKNGFYSFKAAYCPVLKDVHKDRRLSWAKDKLNWSLDDWKRVIWSDESKFNVVGKDGGIRAIRKENEMYKDEHIVKTHKYGNGSVMIWSCFWDGGFGPLVFMDGKINQEKYIECLEASFLSWLQKTSQKEEKDFIFQEDGASCHTGRIASSWNGDQPEIHVFDYWSAQSPGLNPIEHVWVHLEKGIQWQRHMIKNEKQLEACLKEEWNKLSIVLAQKLVRSMPSRCQSVIDAKGRSTRY